MICLAHKMKFADRGIVLYAFCSSYVDPEPDKNGDWLDQEIADRSQLDPQMMYLWLPRGSNQNDFDYVPLATIREFQHWTHEIFVDRLVKAVAAYQSQIPPSSKPSK